MSMTTPRWILGSLALLAMSATAFAQMVEDSEGPLSLIGSITYEGPALDGFDDEFEFCPNLCYTDVVQRTVIRCEATVGPVDDQPPINDQGEFVGQVPRWRIQEHHLLVEQSVRQESCHRDVRDTVLQDLGTQPQYFPGDPDIKDTRTPRELGIAPFDCNDHYPVSIDHTQSPPIMSTELSFDLLIERLYFTCH
jgi:hypothetical protein